MGRFSSIRVRFLRLHVFTWLVVLIATAAAVLLFAPGGWSLSDASRWQHPRDTDPGWADEAANEVFEATLARHSVSLSRGQGILLFEHGWPFPYLVRSRYLPLQALGGPKDDSAPLIEFETYATLATCMGPEAVSWSDYDNWPFESDSFRFHLGYALTDLGIAAGLVGLLAGLTEWRIRKRGGLFRFRLIDLFSVVTLAALLLGWYQFHVKTEQSDQQILAELGLSQNRDRSITHRYIGPQWLVKLTGNSELLPDFLFHVTSASFYDHAPSASDLRQLSQLRYVTCVECFHPLSRAALEELSRIDRLRQLSLTLPAQDSLTESDSSLPKKVDLACSADLSLLRALPLLVLELKGNGVALSDVNSLAHIPTLRAVFLTETDIPDGEIRKFQQEHPHLVVRGWSPVEELFRW